MNRSHLIARRLGAALTSVLVAAAVMTAVPTHAKVPRAPHRYPAAIEGLAGYSPQQKCSPWAKPGTSAFANMLLRTYPNSRSLGIVRACGAGGTSEHKEGRAFDWGVSAYNARDRRSVNSLMRWLLKRDKHGNRYAMARRLGIQYMIWNRRIWGSYAASSGWRRYTGASPHTDHVHFSMSWKGARKLTSFWKPRNLGGPSRPPRPQPKPPRPEPTPQPRPNPKPRPAPSTKNKPIPEPRSPRRLPSGPAMVDEQVQLSVRKRGGVTTEHALRKGHRYLVEVSGTYRYGGKRAAVADGECSTAPRSDWQRDRSVRGRDWQDHLDVYIDGHDLYAESDNGEQCDTDTHTYRWVYEAERSGRVPLRVWDPVRYGDNKGRLSVHIVDVDRVRNRMSWRVPAGAGAGVTSPGAIEGGVEYDVTVRGVWRGPNGKRVDAECMTQPGRPWERDRDDDFDVLLDRTDRRFLPVVDTGGDCNTENHAYTYTYTPDDTRPVNVRVDDPSSFANNRGSLRVTVAPHVEPAEPEPPATEVVRVDSRDATAVTTEQSYPGGTQLRLTASGWYMLRHTSDWIGADAECTIAAGDRRWVTHRLSGTFDGRRQPLGDIAVDNIIGTWRPTNGSSSCNVDDHRYTRDLRVERDGPVSFVIADDDYSDNQGTLTVTVEVR